MADWSFNGDWSTNGDWEGVLAGTAVGAGAEAESAQTVTPILVTEFVVVGAAIESEQANAVAAPSLSTVGAGWGVPIGIS